ncbi:MAG: HAD-IIIA family hydrolase [Deltaproteobacteria bacterium]|nr:HAD-IIIA family hydrolase [Deltaproteobacteria bacterium]MBW1961623.1 HAD-IIIA family hydrolase [Deltaproteobacteria bacterium]MBW2150093.1 HAD-IIIA family hydrolase [Deltaproteobacteria bacterium]
MRHPKLKDIEALLIDVDGVLTDGTIIYNDNGSEIKAFNVKDGLGIRLLGESGIKICIVTGRRSEALYHRCRNLGIDLIFDNVKDKAAVLKEIEKKTGIIAEKMAAVGDDLTDLPLMNRVGLSIAVSNAHELVLSKADLVTTAPGGEGAVREVCESILKAKALWEHMLKGFS